MARVSPEFRRVALLLIAASLVYCLPLFGHLDNWGRQDWDQFTFRYATPRVALIRDHVLPTWNPYANGGNVLLAHPNSPVLSPWYLLVLGLGAPIGLRVQVLLFMALGAVGMAALVRRLGATSAGSVAAGIVFMMSSHFALHVAEGHMEWGVLGLMPWLALCVLRLDEGRRYLILGALLLASVLTFGAVYIPAVFLPFITVWVLGLSIQRRNWRLSLRWIALVSVAVLLSSAKLLPTVTFASDAVREVKLDQRTRPRVLLTALFDPRQALLYQSYRDRNLPDGHFAKVVDNAEGVPAVAFLERLRVDEGFHEYGCYAGIVGILLAAWGGIRSFRRLWPLYAAGGVAIVIALGASAPVDLWSAIRQLPMYGQLQVPGRFVAALTFVIAVAAAMGMGPVTDRLRGYRPRLRRAVSVLLILGLYVELTAIGWTLFRDVFIVPAVSLPAHSQFAQRYQERFAADSGERSYGLVMQSSMYAHLVSNSGTVDAYENLSVPAGEVLTTEAPNYRGEVYLENGGAIEVTVWTMSRIVVRLPPGQDDTLSLNQNFSPGWRARVRDGRGTPTDRAVHRSPRGLVSVAVAPEDREIELFYRPSWLWAGFSISGATLVFCLAGLLFSASGSSKSLRMRRGSPRELAQ